MQQEPQGEINPALFKVPEWVFVEIDKYHVIYLKLQDLLGHFNILQAQQTELIDRTREHQLNQEISNQGEQVESVVKKHLFNFLNKSDGKKAFTCFTRGKLHNLDDIEKLIINGVSFYSDYVYVECDAYENKLNIIKKVHDVSGLDLRIRIVKRIPRDVTTRKNQKGDEAKNSQGSTSESQCVDTTVASDTDKDASTVPDQVTVVNTRSISADKIVLTFTPPDSNGAPITHYQIFIENELDPLQDFSFIIINASEDQTTYEQVIQFGQVGNVDFGNKILPFGKLIRLAIHAKNKNGWSNKINQKYFPLFVTKKEGTTLLLKGKLIDSLLPLDYIDSEEDHLTPDNQNQGILCQKSFRTIKIEEKNVRDVSIKYQAAILLSNNFEACHWGQMLSFEDDSETSLNVKMDEDVCAVDPFRLPINAQISKVSCGLYHCLAVSIHGIVFAWGLNASGQLGNGSIESTTVPIELSYFKLQNEFIDDVCASAVASICKTQKGTLYAWGERQYYLQGNLQAMPVLNDYGDIVNYQCDDSCFKLLNPIKKLENVTKITAGLYHYGALTNNGDVYTWGDNYRLCLGISEYCLKPIKNLVNPIRLDLQLHISKDKVVDIQFGHYHSLAKVKSGQTEYVLSWGDNSGQQCGQNSQDEQRSINKVEGLPSGQIISLDGGLDHSIFLFNDQSLYGCGSNQCYQLADSNQRVYSRATLLPNNYKIRQVMAGAQTTGILIL